MGIIRLLQRDESAVHAGGARAPQLQPDARAEAPTCLGAFELLDAAGLENVTRVRAEARPPPVSREEWGAFFDAQGAPV